MRLPKAENVEIENKTRKDFNVLSESSKNELIMSSIVNQG